MNSKTHELTNSKAHELKKTTIYKNENLGIKLW